MKRILAILMLSATAASAQFGTTNGAFGTVTTFADTDYFLLDRPGSSTNYNLLGSSLKTQLGLLYQPLDSDLTSIAALTTTAFGRGLLTEANAASIRSTIGAGTSSFDGTWSSLSGKPDPTGTGGLVLSNAPTIYNPTFLGDAAFANLNVTNFYTKLTNSAVVGTDGDGKIVEATAGTDYVTPTGAGGSLTVDASGFNGNLTTSDNTLQEVAQKLDDLTVTGGSGVRSWSYGNQLIGQTIASPTSYRFIPAYGNTQSTGDNGIAVLGGTYSNLVVHFVSSIGAGTNATLTVFTNGVATHMTTSVNGTGSANLVGFNMDDSFTITNGTRMSFRFSTDSASAWAVTAGVTILGAQ